MKDLKYMSAGALATVTLAVVTLIGIAIVTEFKNSSFIDNTTADLFIAGLVVFGTFMSLITLVVVGKLIIGLVKNGMD